jgi:two-component system phosphate regulon sensor histidine kinase PhoR
MMKNVTPLGLTRIMSGSLAGFVLLVLVVFRLVSPSIISWWVVAVVPVLLLITTYIFTYQVLNRFLYRKIKLIYKTIYDTRLPEEEKSKSVEMGQNVIKDAESMVIEWRQRKTKELMKQKKMEKYRKEFLGNVFHELKTPIFNIQGYIDTLVEGGINDPEINVKFMQKARKNVVRMTEIVNDLQMIANLEDGSFSFMEEKFDIHQLAQDALEAHEIGASRKEILLRFKDGCDKPFIVKADRELILQVLNNLITNSIKYGKQGGKVQIGLYDMNEKVLIEVSDNGIGIAQKHLPRIFERFYRADKNRSRDLGGSGLGLSIVKHIIEAHDQTINIRSTRGIGTTIGFTLKKA